MIARMAIVLAMVIGGRRMGVGSRQNRYSHPGQWRSDHRRDRGACSRPARIQDRRCWHHIFRVGQHCTGPIRASVRCQHLGWPPVSWAASDGAAIGQSWLPEAERGCDVADARGHRHQRNREEVLGAQLDGSVDAGFNYTRSSGIAQTTLNSNTVYRRPALPVPAHHVRAQ